MLLFELWTGGADSRGSALQSSCMEVYFLHAILHELSKKLDIPLKYHGFMKHQWFSMVKTATFNDEMSVKKLMCYKAYNTLVFSLTFH